MKKILVGAVRSEGKFEKNGKEIKYDNINLHLVEYRDKDAKGFTVGRNFEAVKIRTADFLDVCGVSVKRFFAEFESKYMFTKVRVIGEQNDYDGYDVTEVQFSQKKCFELWRELRDAALEAGVDIHDEDVETDLEADMINFEELDVNTETGEVTDV